MNKLIQIENGQCYIVSDNNIKYLDHYIFTRISNGKLAIARNSITKDIVLRKRNRGNRIIGKVIIKITNIKYKQIK